jgi:hypothetical protein
MQIEKQIELESTQAHTLWAMAKVPSARRRLITGFLIQYEVLHPIYLERKAKTIHRALAQSTGVQVLNIYSVTRNPLFLSPHDSSTHAWLGPFVQHAGPHGLQATPRLRVLRQPSRHLQLCVQLNPRSRGACETLSDWSGERPPSMVSNLCFRRHNTES